MQGCGVFPSACYGSLNEGKVLSVPATVATSRVDKSDKNQKLAFLEDVQL